MAKKPKTPARLIATTKSSLPPLNAIAGPMDPALLERLLRLMSENDVNSLEVRDGQKRVSLKRGPQSGKKASRSSAADQPLATSPAAPPSVAATPAPTPADEEASFKQITSPMPGTFYLSPSPGAKPFVQVGSTVNEETDVCLIEAMKVFNNIKAEVRGTIAKILVENNKPVEYGTVLFLVKP